MPKITNFFLFLFFICFSIFLLHLAITKTAVYGDGRYYYTITRSIIIDHDLNFNNEYQYFGISEPKLPTGLSANKYPPGSSFLWIPLFFLTHLIWHSDGYALPYQISCAVTSILLTLAGLILLFKTLIKYYSLQVSLFTVFCLVFATNLLFYMGFDVINSHAVSFALACILLYLILIKTDNRLLGFVSGLIVLTRSLDFTIAILALIMLLKKQTRKFLSLFIFSFSFIFAFLPQLYFWKTIYGLVNSPYLIGNERFNLTSPHLIGLLFNPHTGLITKTPFVFIGILGILLLRKKLADVKYLFLIMIVIQFYLISSWSSWDQGGSFGVRMMVSLLPFIAFGIAEIINLMMQKYQRKKTILIICISSFVNFVLIIQYLLIN